MHDHIKKILAFLFIVLFSYSIYKNIDISLIKIEITKSFLINILISITLYFVSIVFIAIRWFILLKRNSIKINFYKLFYISYISNSVSTYIPGMVLGDYYRFYLFKKITSSIKIDESILSTIVIDRFLSLFSIILSITFIASITLSGLSGFNIPIFNILLIIILISFIIIFFTYIFRKKIINIFTMYEGLGGIKVYNFFKYVNNNKFLFALLLPISMIANLIVLTSFHFITLAYQQDIDFIASSLAVLLAFLGTLIPISPSGLGISDYIYSESYQILSNTDYNIIHIYVIFRLVVLLVYIPSIILIAKENLFKFK